jgi:secondary thiamine-phosphate synthase enzyme
MAARRRVRRERAAGSAEAVVTVRGRNETGGPHQLSASASVAPEMIVTATLSVASGGPGFTEITDDVMRFIANAGARDGVLLLFLRHTSASLVIQENADPDVRTDLATALDRLAPAGAHWVHDVEGPDDMPAHVKTMLTGVSLHVPVADGSLRLGHWQGIYLAEHRAHRGRREVVLQFMGNRARSAHQP